MSDFAITFARSARKYLAKLPSQMADKILDEIEKLVSNPRPAGCKRLKGFKHLWRIRSGDYRVIYSINEGTRVVDISIVRHRKDVYRIL